MISELDKNILQKIITSDSYLSGSFLSQLCNVSINTIRKEIDIINDYLKDHGCHIETKIAMGYNLIITDPETANPFIEQLLQDIRCFRYLNLSEYANAYYILRQLLITNDYLTVDSFTEALYCSKSTILRTLDRVRDYLSLFHLELKSRRNYGIRIEGNEWNRRVCLLFQHKVYIHNLDQSEREPKFEAAFLMNSEFPQKIRKSILDYFASHNEVSLPNIDFAKIFNLILLQKTRRNCSEKQTFSPKQLAAAENSPMLPIAQGIICHLPRYFKEDLHPNDLLTLTMILSACQTMDDSSKIQEKDRQECKAEVQKMLHFFSLYFDISGLFDPLFHEDFACYLYSLKLRLLFEIPADEEMIAPQTKLGLFTNDLCALFALFFYHHHGILLHESDLTGAYSIINRSLYENQMFYDKKRVIVASRYGLYFAKNLARRIWDSFPGKFLSVSPVEYTDLFSLDWDQVDLLATDVRDANLPQPKSIPLINIQFFRTNNDLKPLNSYLSNQLRKNALAIFTEECLHKGNFQTKEEIYHEFYSFFQEEVGDYERFIRDLTLRDSFISFEREKGLVLITPLAIRLAHPVFHVLVNHKPLIWNQQRSSVFIFYQQGDGSHRNTQLISFLLKQFLHQSDNMINSMVLKSYREIIKEFHNLDQ